MQASSAIESKFAEQIGETTDKYVVAVSGGLDSAVLAHLCLKVLACDKFTVAHFNHRTRGTHSDDDELFVRELAESFGVEYRVAYRTVDDLSEAALRTERHAFFERVRLERQAQYILTAHHLDDQLETMIMRLIRGTGVEGLGAIRGRDAIYVRPLLGFTREELELYADDQKISYRTDASNSEPVYFRNRVRFDVVPNLAKLAQEFGGKTLFLRRVGALADELQMVADKTRADILNWSDKWVTRTPYWTRFRVDAFLKLENAEQATILRSLIFELTEVSPSREHVDRLIENLANGVVRWDLGGGNYYRISCGYCFLIRGEMVAPSIARHGNIAKFEPLGLELELNDELGEGVEVRFFRPGDLYKGQKLKHWWLKKRIPQPERALIPLLAQGSQVLWCYPEPHPNVRILRNGFSFTDEAMNQSLQK